MRWSLLAELQRLRVVQVISVWFVLTPLAIRVFESPNMRSMFGGIQIPFSLYAFYAASASFFFSSIVYALFCPSIIRDYGGWYDFNVKEGSFERLLPILLDVLRLVPKQERDAFLMRQCQLRALQLRTSDQKDVAPESSAWAEHMQDYGKLLRNSRAHPERLNDLFSAGRELAQSVRPTARATATLLQLVGWFFIAIVVAQNAMSVTMSICPRCVALFGA